MDDWKVKVQPCEKVFVPSFIRLFVMTRILKHCNVSVEHIKQMETTIQDLKQQQIAHSILTRLINDGIKKYMEKWFNEKEQRQVIEIIFNTIILKKFEKEYKSIVNHNNKTNDINSSNCKSQYYQRLVFNTDDLMYLIFQFVELSQQFSGDLINCSLVNSDWLYQSWNPNSIYYLCLDSLINNTVRMTKRPKSEQSTEMKDVDRILASKWQRVVNVKSVLVRLALYGFKEIEELKLQYFFTKISMLRSIVKIDLFIDIYHISLLKPLVYCNKENIEKYSVIITSGTEQIKPTPLELINGKDILIRDMLYYVMWSNRCKTLKLKLDRIDENWIKYVIDNCDCSGVETFLIEDISFSESLNPDTKSTQMLFNKFSQKFTNLQSLKIAECQLRKNMCLVLLLRCLSGIIKKNKTVVELKVNSGFPDCDKLVKMIQDTEIAICGLNVLIDIEKSIDCCLIPIVLNNSKLEYLKMSILIYRMGYYGDAAQQSILHLLSKMQGNDNESSEKAKLSLSSLKMIEIREDYPNARIHTINKILMLKLMKKDTLYTRMSFDFCGDHSSVFQTSFKKMCQIVASLLTSQYPIPFELNISIRAMEKSHFEKTYYPIFEQCLNQNVIKNIKAPIIKSKYYKVLPKPVICFKYDGQGSGKMLFQVTHVTKNFEYAA